MAISWSTYLPNRVIFHPVFLPAYILLVIYLIYWSASLAWAEIAANHPSSTSPSSNDDRSFPVFGLAIVAAGFGFIHYFRYLQQFDMKPYTAKQVAEKTSMADGGAVWLVVNREVYDVTRFVQKHPPGSQLILRNAGTDATRHFDYHLESTKHFWRHSKIGWLVDEDVKA